MAEALVDTGYAQVQKDPEKSGLQISILAIWIHQLIYIIKTIPHDITFKNQIKDNIRTTLYNLSKARSGKEFYTDYCFHEKPAESYCRDCKDFLDAPCVQYHNEIKLLIPHSVFNFMGRKVKNKHVLNFAPKSLCRIPGHNQKEIGFYCQDCTMLLCEIGRRQHEGHILKTLNKGNEMEQMFNDIMLSCGENPQCQLKEIRDLTNSIITSPFGGNLVQIVETLASIASSDFVTVFSQGNDHLSDTNNLCSMHINPTTTTDVNNDPAEIHMETLCQRTEQSADTGQLEQNATLQTSAIHFTGNGFAVHVPCEENNFTKSADMEKGTLPGDVQNSLDTFQDLHPRNSS